MAEAIFGEDVVVEILVVDVYYPVLCGTDCVFTRDVEFIPITGPSSIAREFMPRKEEWSVSVTGLTKVENTAQALTFFYLLQSSVRRVLQTIRLTFTDSDGDAKQITGNVYIGSQSISGPATEFANCVIEFKGTGVFALEEIAPPTPADFDILSDYWATVNGQNYISGASSGEYTGTSYTLAAIDTVLEVGMEGTQYEIVSGTPTAGQRECQFSTSPVRVIFPSDVIFDGSQRVFVMFKRPI